MDRELMELERKIIDSVYVKMSDELIEYFQSMTSDEADIMIEKPFPQFEDSFLLWSLERHVRQYMKKGR